MKMGVGTRVVFSIFLLLVIGVCGIIIFAALGGFPEENMMELFRGLRKPTSALTGWGPRRLCLSAVCLLFLDSGHRDGAGNHSSACPGRWQRQGHFHWGRCRN